MMSKIQPIEPYVVNDIDAAIQRLYRNDIGVSRLPFAARLQQICSLFMGTPYLNNALGEGVDGLFDQNPLYRLNAFDCVTFVNTVIALAKGYDLASFRTALFNLSYDQGQVAYQHRNHFMSADWNINNAQNGFIKDVTHAVKGNDKAAIIERAHAEINKPACYQHKTFANLHFLAGAGASLYQQRLSALHAMALEHAVESVVTPYLALTQLFDRQGMPVITVWDQLPACCVLQIVRPNWDMRSKIGTRLNISHLGFVWRDGSGAHQFCHASQINKRVEIVSLQTYLQQRLHSPSIKGVNLQLLL